MSAIGTSRTSRHVRYESAQWAKADIDQVTVTNRDFMSTRPKYVVGGEVVSASKKSGAVGGKKKPASPIGGAAFPAIGGQTGTRVRSTIKLRRGRSSRGAVAIGVGIR